MTTWVSVRKPYEILDVPDDADMEGPAAYRFGWVLYVGGCSNVRRRLGDHKRAGMLSAVRSGAIFPCATEEAALRLEKALIWLLKPSENQEHPEPTGSLWAATLGRERPIQQWRWFGACGHVEFEGRTLADSSDVAEADCRCTPWDGWLDKAKRYVARLESQVADLHQAMEEAEEHFANERRESDESIENERWDLERERRALEMAACEGCEERDATIEKLKTMLAQAQEAEWTA